MPLATVSKRVGALFALTLIGATLVLPNAAGASVGPVQVPLKDPGPPSCPTGSYVAINPGPSQSPFFVLKTPGPGGCAPGIDFLRTPGPNGAPQGIAVALPLTAADCAQGTALFDTELLLLGGALPGPTPGTIGSSGASGSVCPSGDAALSALQAAMANIGVAPGSFGLDKGGPVGPRSLPAVQNPGGYLLVDPGTSPVPALGGIYGDDSTGTPIGEVVVAFLEGDPDQPIVVENLDSSLTPGVSVLRAPGPVGAPTLDAVVCIQLGGVWQQAGTCEVAGVGIAPSSFTIPPATTLQVDPGGSLNNGGILTVNGNITNDGSLTVSPGGAIDLGPGGSLNDGGVLTLNGTPANPGSLSISGGGVLTLGPSGSLNDGGVLTLGGTPANPGSLSISGGGILTLGPSGSLNDVGGILTLGGNATNNGSVTIGPNGVTTIQQGGSLVNGGTLTLNGSLTNDGTLINNGSFVDQGVFVDNGTCVNC
jgi:fibronectin-binding autotransporter adhesin